MIRHSVILKMPVGKPVLPRGKMIKMRHNSPLVGSSWHLLSHPEPTEAAHAQDARLPGKGRLAGETGKTMASHRQNDENDQQLSQTD